MNIVIPDDYQDIVHRLDCFRLLAGHQVTRYRAPGARPRRTGRTIAGRRHPRRNPRAGAFRPPADRTVARLKLIALVGPPARSTSPPAPSSGSGRHRRERVARVAGRTRVAVICERAAMSSREAEGMRMGDWPRTRSYRLPARARHLRSGPIGTLVAAAGRARHGNLGVGPRELATEAARRRLRVAASQAELFARGRSAIIVRLRRRRAASSTRRIWRG